MKKHEDYLQGMVKPKKKCVDCNGVVESEDCEYCKDKPIATHHKSERDRLYGMIEILGNGDAVRGMAMLEQITDRLNHARAKHPHFANDLTHAVHLLQDEGDEVTKALLVETDERVIDETLDVIAVGVRLLGGEYTKKKNED